MLVFAIIMLLLQDSFSIKPRKFGRLLCLHEFSIVPRTSTEESLMERRENPAEAEIRAFERFQLAAPKVDHNFQTSNTKPDMRHPAKQIF